MTTVCIYTNDDINPGYFESDDLKITINNYTKKDNIINKLLNLVLTRGLKVETTSDLNIIVKNSSHYGYTQNRYKHNKFKNNLYIALKITQTTLLFMFNQYNDIINSILKINKYNFNTIISPPPDACRCVSRYPIFEYPCKTCQLQLLNYFYKRYGYNYYSISQFELVDDIKNIIKQLFLVV